MSSILSYAPILDAAVEAAQTATAILRFECARPGGPRGLSGHCPADDEAEHAIRRYLLGACPTWGFNGEETGFQAPAANEAHLWLVDPNDGTDSMQKGYRGHAVSIAALRNGEPVLGVVYAVDAPDDDGDLFAWAEGCSPVPFRPNNLVTRGQLAKIVSNAAGFTEDPDPQIFEDVSSSNTFYQWINRLARRGHMSGYPCGGPGEPCTTGMPYFRPFANATRGQTSKIVSNAAGYSEIPTDQTFEDVPQTHTFYMEIQRLATRNIMQGYPCGGVGEPCLSGKPYFRPANNVTRGQSAKIVANTFYPGCETP